MDEAAGRRRLAAPPPRRAAAEWKDRTAGKGGKDEADGKGGVWRPLDGGAELRPELTCRPGCDRADLRPWLRPGVACADLR